MADGLVTITVDGVSWQVPEGQNLLQACLSRGIDLPYFCWHPALGSVGACRQCAVVQYADPEDECGRLTMACMTPVAEGARFSAAAGSAMSFRASVIEWLMENHPHDCPVCEEGGECHLQDDRPHQPPLPGPETHL
jgi:NADH-quinone oxidoreductase subunit G